MLMNRDVIHELFREFGRIQGEMDHILRRSGIGIGRGVIPAFTVWEDEQAVYAETDLPGVDPAKLDVSITEGNTLTVSGERSVPEVAGAVWRRQERGFGQFSRTLTLPTVVNADTVEAKYDNGVLRLTLPKAEAAKPRKIAIR